MQKFAPTTTSEDAKELVRLCLPEGCTTYRNGSLRASLWKCLPRGRKACFKSPLKPDSTALLIAKHEGDQASKNATLADAVALRRTDFVELLLEHGAEITSVPFADVLLAWEPKLIRFFLDHRADPIKGSPFAVAFGAKVRTALRAFLECKRMHHEHASALEEQANIAPR